MKQILLFGAGKSATVLIDYLIKNAPTEQWQLLLADTDLLLAQSKIGNSVYAKAIAIDVNIADERKKFIQEADIVISLLPPSLHILIARDCITLKKNLLTASYVDDEIKSLEKEIEANGLLFLYEMGLDPGIDHMSASKIIHEIQEAKGEITSFISHCGGLVAPESDDNPWHYKISWNPKNIVLAGKAGAHYKQDNVEIQLDYEALFREIRLVQIPDFGMLAWYPNRDSLSYAQLYGLENTATFIRTTLRHPDFIYGWQNILNLQLTNETPAYETKDKSLQTVFKEHMDKNNFGDWVSEKMKISITQATELLEQLVKLTDKENEAAENGEEIDESFLAADEQGNIITIDINETKSKAAESVYETIHQTNLLLKQLFFLGMDDDETEVNKGLCSAADLLQFALEKKLLLQPADKDMIAMLHEIEYENGGKKNKINSSLLVKGEDALHTAMAKTVGLPLGIAAKLILNGTIQQTGLQIPIQKEIYTPVLKELAQHGIEFSEQVVS